MLYCFEPVFRRQAGKILLLLYFLLSLPLPLLPQLRVSCLKHLRLASNGTPHTICRHLSHIIQWKQVNNAFPSGRLPGNEPAPKSRCRITDNGYWWQLQLAATADINSSHSVMLASISFRLL